MTRGLGASWSQHCPSNSEQTGTVSTDNVPFIAGLIWKDWEYGLDVPLSIKIKKWKTLKKLDKVLLFKVLPLDSTTVHVSRGLSSYFCVHFFG